MFFHRFCTATLVVFALTLPGARRSAADVPVSAEVVVYGGTPAGIAAALASAESGDRVLLVEPTRHIGGLVTSGLSHTDFRTYEGLTGAFLAFSRRVEADYRKNYGADSPQLRDCQRGTQAEPHVNERVFEQMLAEHSRLSLQKGWRLARATRTSKAGRARLTGAVFVDAGGTQHDVSARVFIDATYEGDLMAAAGVPWRTGREGRAEYGESLAPETADHQLQAYNFRVIMTPDPDRRVAVSKPDGYRREDFVEVLPLLQDGRIQRIFGYPSACIFKAQIPPLPNGIYDINDVSSGLVRLSMPGENLTWPNGSPEDRARIFAVHQRYHVGLLWFLQHDPEVPENFRKEAQQWGWSREQFTDNDHFPWQLYVREARRMVGLRVFTELDTNAAPGDARSVFQPDSIAMGDYGPNCHGTAHTGPRFGGRHNGEFYKRVAPYQIPYGTLVPREVDNLLVPGACSASHVGFCALRLEPIWMSLGEAAGIAAHQALANNVPVQNVPIAEIRRQQHRRGAATLYVSDVLPGHPDFQAVQWWGSLGGLHGLAPLTGEYGQRGKNIIGQYFEAFPNHAAELDRELDRSLLTRWLELAKASGISTDGLAEAKTRGQFIRRAAMNHTPSASRSE